MEAESSVNGAEVPKWGCLSWHAAVELRRWISGSVPGGRLVKPSGHSGGRQGCGSGDEGVGTS
jgi:hypothetical protein